jgi:hypothetical protein
MTTDQLLKKSRVIGRLVEEVALYNARFHCAMPLKILSAKYSRALGRLGGFHETMRELENDGSLRLERQRSGRTDVFAGGMGLGRGENVLRFGRL